MTWGAEYDDADTSIYSGATLKIMAEVGELSKATSDEVESDFSSLLTSCSVDSGQDAVVPVRLTITNTSDHVLRARVSLFASGTSFDPDVLPIDIATNGDCTSGAPFNGYDGEPVPTTIDFDGAGPGKDVVKDVLVVVHRYFDSEHPDGQPGELGGLIGQLEPKLISSNGDELDLSQTCYSGPTRFPGLYLQGRGPGLKQLSPGFRFGDDVDISGGEVEKGGQAFPPAIDDNYRIAKEKHPAC